MRTNLVIFFTIFFICGFASSKRQIPNYIHICKRSDPNVSRCIKNSIETLRSHLVKGIPELDVPSIEPLQIKEINLFKNTDRGSNIEAYVRNLQAYGGSNFQIKKIKVDSNKHTYRVDVSFPELYAVGDYDVDAKILIPLKSNGKFIANITNIDGHCIIRSEIVEKDGIRELRFIAFQLDIKVGDYNIHIDNLFRNDPVLSQAANELLTNNKQELLEMALPYIKQKVTEYFFEIANKITDGLDHDEVYPAK